MPERNERVQAIRVLDDCRTVATFTCIEPGNVTAAARQGGYVAHRSTSTLLKPHSSLAATFAQNHSSGLRFTSVLSM
jgi:hypothetical protein